MRSRIGIRDPPPVRAKPAPDSSSARVADTITVTGNPFTVTFETLDGLTVAGVWNADLARIEF